MRAQRYHASGIGGVCGDALQSTRRVNNTQNGSLVVGRVERSTVAGLEISLNGLNRRWTQLCGWRAAWKWLEGPRSSAALSRVSCCLVSIKCMRLTGHSTAYTLVQAGRSVRWRLSILFGRDSGYARC